MCLAVTRQGVTLYGNKSAFKSLARWLSWVAGSDASEHYECHVMWHLLSHHARRSNVWVLCDKEMLKVVNREPDGGGKPTFEVTFMAVTARDLRALRIHEREGLLPPNPKEPARSGRQSLRGRKAARATRLATRRSPTTGQ